MCPSRGSASFALFPFATCLFTPPICLPASFVGDAWPAGSAPLVLVHKPSWVCRRGFEAAPLRDELSSRHSGQSLITVHVPSPLHQRSCPARLWLPGRPCWPRSPDGCRPLRTPPRETSNSVVRIHPLGTWSALCLCASMPSAVQQARSPRHRAGV